MRSSLTRSISALTLLAFVGSASPALAQSKGGKGKGGKAPEAAQAPQDPKLIEAKKHMEAGAAFYNDPSGHKCEEAYREFKTAYDLSGSMNALKGMGLCAMELERDGEAINLLDKFLEARGDQLDPADKQQIETDLKALKAAVAWVTLRVDRPGATIIDTRTPARGYPITNRYIGSATGTKIGIHPGQHEFRAMVEGEPEQVWRVEIPNGGKLSHEFEFDKGKPVTAEGFKEGDLMGDKPDQPEEKPSRPVPVSVYVLGGLTAAAAIGGGIAGGLALGKKADYDAAQGTRPRAELEEMKSGVETTNLAADICFGAAAVGAVVTVVLLVTRPSKPSPPKQEAFQIAPMVLGEGGGALVTGTF
ncbi:hypothetical protein [Polyangium aurulentum]|uniref:hypothetical protein n=1 Tax=Polyangium aurulentum TaxID=2567896 RepID=UPI0010AE407D|nr:hypothetical protein [Polyangium aurulentum]UQA61560.1 hypothetical protein E8A73_014250 [Polyangium aurulentum]